MYATDIQYEEVVRRHPEEIKELQSRIARSPHKVRGRMIADISITEFRFTYNTLIRSRSQGLPVNPTVEEIYADKIERCITLLSAYPPHSNREFNIRLPAAPIEVIRKIRESLDRSEAERIKWASFTQEERDQETQAALQELRKDPGFVEIHHEQKGGKWNEMQRM